MNPHPRSCRAGFLLAVTSTLLLGACAGVVSRPVVEDDRDTSGQYDGVWTASVESVGGVQQIERWSFNCAAQDFTFDIAIESGLVRFVNEADNANVTTETYVDTDGRFRLELPLDKKTRAAGESDQQISDGSITIILEGELASDEPGGFYTAGVADFLNRGCRYPVDYELDQ